MDKTEENHHVIIKTQEDSCWDYSGLWKTNGIDSHWLMDRNENEEIAGKYTNS